MNLRYRVELSQTEREQLTALLSGGKHAARRLKRAQQQQWGWQSGSGQPWRDDRREWRPSW